MSALSDNLWRLLNPRHIAFIGGKDAAFSAAQCARHFAGPVWGVNPKRELLGGVPCFASVADLPEAPDAVFLAVPRSGAIATVQQLRDIGCGGIACFTAGYGELGESGRDAERQLIEAAGDMALVGPNCYGLINYTNGACLWPFGAGDGNCQQGIALIMQSGMLPANLIMNDRSVPISYVISAGNQAILAIEDYLELLVEDAKVSAIGMYIESIRNIEKFSRVAMRALSLQKPLVILKAGSSRLAAQLTVSHTGSLAGADAAFQTFFDQLGIIRVDAPVEMLETLKFLSVSGAPHGDRLAIFSCSGGDAAMAADYADKIGLLLKQPSKATARKLADFLPDIATVSNPLDYTTPLWGNTEIMPAVFKTMAADGYDAAVIIQDYPPKHIHEDNSNYLNDGRSFMQACNELGIPGAVCSDLPENIDRETREILIAGGITPLQGLDAGFDTLANACRYGIQRNQLIDQNEPSDFKIIPIPDADLPTRIVDEHQGKQRLANCGIAVPAGFFTRSGGVETLPDAVSFPLIVKAVSIDLPHKSEAGAIRFGIDSCSALDLAIEDIRASTAQHSQVVFIDGFLVENTVENVIMEILVGVKTDPQFGQIMVIAAGGILVELLQDSVTLLLPTTETRVTAALKSLKCFPLLQGFRGKPAADIPRLVATILKLADFAAQHHAQLVELDVNPLIVTTEDCVAADVMIREVIAS